MSGYGKPSPLVFHDNAACSTAYLACHSYERTAGDHFDAAEGIIKHMVPGESMV